MGSFTESLRADVEAQWERILAHPFIAELRDGTLPDERLQFYFEQNVHYIESVVRCRSILAGRAGDRRTRNFWLDRTPVVVEELNHQISMLNSIGGNPEATIAPACYAYTRHLLSMAFSDDPVEWLGSFLPCPWTYDDIGRTFGQGPPQPAHRDWWEFYCSEEHHELVDRYRDYVDAGIESMPKERKDLVAANFRRSLHYEYRFWDMAYTLERWEP